MGQKYKFFVKGNPVSISQDAVFGENDKTLTMTWIDRLHRQDVEAEEHLVVPNLEGFIDAIFRSIPVIKAGGGFVLNPKGQLLMIHRRGYWDLPKGKMENGENIEETAIREVEEECGIKGLSIVSGPFRTYHLYTEKDRTVIKESIWFAMETTSDALPTPQQEEDIDQAVWKSLPLDERLLHEAYPSIVEVIRHFMFSGSSETSGG